MRALRALACGLCLALGVVGLITVSALWWAERTVYDPERVADAAVDVVAEPAVRQALARRVVVELRNGGLDPSFTVQAEELMERTLRQPEVSLAFSAALAAGFTGVVEDGPDELLVGRLSEAYRVARASAVLLDPAAAAVLPVSVELNVELGALADLPWQWRVIDTLRPWLVPLTIATAVLLVLGIALAQWRFRALAIIGAGLAAGSLLFFGGLWLADRAIEDQVTDPVYRQAASTALDVATQDLQALSLVLALVGAGIAVIGVLAHQAQRRW